MATEENDMWDELNIGYENAYRNDLFRRACLEKAIALLKPGSRVLDVGCGTGVPVALSPQEWTSMALTLRPR